MVLGRHIRNFVNRLVRTQDHYLYRINSNGKFTLKVQKHGFLTKLLVYNKQCFTYWPVSFHFSDIFGKKFVEMADIEDNGDLSPPKALGMMVLDRSVFKKKCKIPGIRVPNKYVGIVSKRMKPNDSLLKIPKLKQIAELASDDEYSQTHKLFLLNPEKYQSVKSFSDNEIKMLKENEVEVESFQMYSIELCYDNWSATDILKAVIPDPTVSISGFSIIGHIAHLNLKKEVMQYKNIIGEVLMDKNPVIKTVVNKTNEIDNTFRNFKMELLAGEDNMVTQAKEHGLIFEFDFSKVYWNPRLATEHQRVITDIKSADVIYDVFAGVGPFAIPAAKFKKAIVFANDLNPHSYDSLCKNIKLNKVKTEIKCSNLDGRDFIKTVLKQDLLDRWTSLKETGEKQSFKVVMNLPALGIEFTDAFKELFKDIDEKLIPTSEDLFPYMYVYCFSKSDIPELDVKERIEGVIGSPLPENHTIRHVRNVAPNKNMLCISFHMPPEVLFGKSMITDNLDNGPDEKRRKLDIQSELCV